MKAESHYKPKISSRFNPSADRSDKKEKKDDQRKSSFAGLRKFNKGTDLVKSNLKESFIDIETSDIISCWKELNQEKKELSSKIKEFSLKPDSPENKDFIAEKSKLVNIEANIQKRISALNLREFRLRLIEDLYIPEDKS